MLRIDWTQVKNLKAHLLRQGYTEDTEVGVMLLYRGSVESQQTKIKLKRLEQLLYDVCDHVDITGFYVFDAELKKPLWRVRETDSSSNTVESIPSSGHPNIVLDFGNMSPEQKEVWVAMTEASLQQYLTNEVTQ